MKAVHRPLKDLRYLKLISFRTSPLGKAVTEEYECHAQYGLDSITNSMELSTIREVTTCEATW
jgi:hypothetical protein